MLYMWTAVSSPGPSRMWLLVFITALLTQLPCKRHEMHTLQPSTQVNLAFKGSTIPLLITPRTCPCTQMHTTSWTPSYVGYLLNADPIRSPCGATAESEAEGNGRNLASTCKKLHPSLVAWFQVSSWKDIRSEVQTKFKDKKAGQNRRRFN